MNFIVGLLCCDLVVVECVVLDLFDLFWVVFGVGEGDVILCEECELVECYFLIELLCFGECL